MEFLRVFVICSYLTIIIFVNNTKYIQGFKLNILNKEVLHQRIDNEPLIIELILKEQELHDQRHYHDNNCLYDKENESNHYQCSGFGPRDLNGQLQAKTQSTSNPLDNDKLCVLIDGMICQCFKEEITSLSLILPKQCLPIEKFWFSIALFDVGRNTFTISDGYLVPGSTDMPAHHQNAITMVLPLTLDDISRAVILLQSIADNCGLSNRKETADSCQGRNNVDCQDSYLCPIEELIVVVPDKQWDIISLALQSFYSILAFPCRTIQESSVYYNISKAMQPWLKESTSKIHNYVIQMSIKLLIASIVRTRQYITLDADVVLLNRFTMKDLVDIHGRAVYHNENRHSFHPDWYEASESYLDIRSDRPESQGFGVTPAVLSSYGSLLTISLILGKYESEVYRRISHSDRSNYNETFEVLRGSGWRLSGPILASYTETLRLTASDGTYSSVHQDVTKISPHHESRLKQWLHSFGRDGVKWTEYTLYRICLDYLQVNGLEIHTN